MKKTLTLCFAILFSLTLLICTSADEEAYAKEIKFTYVLETSNGSVNAKNKLADKDFVNSSISTATAITSGATAGDLSRQIRQSAPNGRPTLMSSL